MKVTAILLFFLVNAVQAKPDTIIILDASGSMWGQIDGISKIEIAREALQTVSKSISPDQKVGLMAYGHRSKGDCGDIELLLSPATGQADKIISTVNALMPKGKTPLTAAVKQAAEILKITENAAEIVLITDGLETCDLDPCAAGEELAAMGIDFKAHVIGFGLNADEGKQVACLAELTGGWYVSAQNAQELDAALQQVMITEEAEELPVELPKALIEAPSESPSVAAKFKVVWEGPNGDKDYIDIVEVGSTRTNSELAYGWTKNGSPTTLMAPSKPGSYDLRYVWQGPKARHVLAQVTIEVVDSKATLIAPQQVNIGEEFEVSWQGPGGQGDYVDLVAADYEATSGEISYFYTHDAQSDKGYLTAPGKAGDYQIRYVLQGPEARQVLHQIELQVRTIEATLIHPSKANIAQQVTVQWKGPGGQKDYVDVVPADYTSTNGEISYFYTRDNAEQGQVTMPIIPGQYQIRYIIDAAGSRKVMANSPITVEDMTTVLNLAKDKVAAGSQLEIKWQGPGGKNDYIDLVPAGYTKTSGELSYFYTKGNPEKGMLKAPDKAGQYQVRYIIQDHKSQRVVLLSEALTVE